MMPGENQAPGDGIATTEIVSMPAELDIATSEGAVKQAYAAIARSAGLLLRDLTGLPFCDARS